MSSKDPQLQNNLLEITQRKHLLQYMTMMNLRNHRHSLHR